MTAVGPPVIQAGSIVSEQVYAAYTVAASEAALIGTQITNNLLAIQANMSALYFGNQSFHRMINGYLAAKGFDLPVKGVSGYVGFSVGNF